MENEPDVIWENFLQRLQNAESDPVSWCKWFSNLLDQRGSFTYILNPEHKGCAPRFAITSERDYSLLKKARDILDVGSYKLITPRTLNQDGSKLAQRVLWDIRSKQGLNLLIQIIEHYPLQFRKKIDEYEQWKNMVEEYTKYGYKSPQLQKWAIRLSQSRKRGHAKSARKMLGIFDGSKSENISDTVVFPQYPIILDKLTNIDQEIKERCFPILAMDKSNPKLWDSAVRTANTILEERLRRIGQISDINCFGQRLVKNAFGPDGVLAQKFKNDQEREAYIGLYAGTMGIFRNPSAHHLIDPNPEEGSVIIAFIDLLIKKLEKL